MELLLHCVERSQLRFRYLISVSPLPSFGGFQGTKLAGDFGTNPVHNPSGLEHLGIPQEELENNVGERPGTPCLI